MLAGSLRYPGRESRTQIRPSRPTAISWNGGFVSGIGGPFHCQSGATRRNPLATRSRAASFSAASTGTGSLTRWIRSTVPSDRKTSTAYSVESPPT